MNQGILKGLAIHMVLAGFAWCQDAQPEPEPEKAEQEQPERELPPRVVKARRGSTATRTDLPLRETPQSVDVIPRELSQEQGVLTLQDALERNAPSFGFDTGENNHDQLALRGLDVDFMRDGFREQRSSKHNLSDVERVEVLRGPASVLYGRGVAGGTINLISKMPVRETHREIRLYMRSFFGDPDAGFQNRGGGFDDYTLNVDLGGPLAGKEAFYRFTAQVDEADGWRDFVWHSDRDAAFAVRWLTGQESALTLRLAVYNRRFVQDRGLVGFGDGDEDQVFPDVDRRTFYGSRAQLSRDNTYLLYAAYETSPGRSVRLRNLIQVRRNEGTEVSLRPRRVEDNFIGPFGGIPGSDGVPESVEREQRIFTLWMWEVSDRLEVLWDLEPHDILAGIQLGGVTVHHDDFRLRDPGNLSDPIFHTPWLDPDPNVGVIEADFSDPRASRARQRSFRGRYIALYAQDILTPGPSWKLVLNLRGENYDEELEDPLNTSNPDQKVSETVLGGRVGAVYEVSKGSSLYAVAAVGYRPRGVGMPFGGDLERSDGKDFKIETNTLFEVGNKTDLLDGRLSLTVALFRQIQEDFTTTDPNTGLTEQIGETRVDGFEVTLSGSLSEAWFIHAFYGLLNAEFVENFSGGNDLSGNTPANVPDNTLGLWTSYEPAGGWAWGGGFRWVDERPGENANTSTLDAYFVVDLFVRRRLGSWGTVALVLKNVFDEEYFVSGTRFGDFAMPGEPFNAMITLDGRF